MKRATLLLLALAFRMAAYNVSVSTDAPVNAQGAGGRINYVPTPLPNVSGCTAGYLCVAFDSQQYAGVKFSGVSGADQEIAIKTVNGGTPICITCGQHVALFGSDYSATVLPDTLPANLGTPVLDPTGSWMAMEVADPVLINSYGCPDNALGNKPSSANAGAGFCMNIWVCAFNPGFTVEGSVSTNALSHCTNETNFPHNAAGAQQGALHPRWGNNTANQLFAWSQQDNNGTSAYCSAVPVSCGQGEWSIHIGTISNAVFKQTVSYSYVSPTNQYLGWFEPGNFGGTRSADIATNTDDGFFTFVTNSGAYGQPWFCPDLWAVHWSDNTFSRLTTTGQNCLTNASEAAWNEHPTFSPDGSVISYVSALGNGWKPGLSAQIPLDIWEATITLSGSSASISNEQRLTYYSGNYPTESENHATPVLINSQMQWNLDGQHIVHITTCAAAQTGCTAAYGDRVLEFNPLQVGGGAVANAASYSLPVAPGSIAAAFGDFQLLGTFSTSAFPIPTSLGGLSLEIGTIASPLFFAGYGQVNVQIPWELAGKTQTTVTASINGVTSASVSGQTSAPQTVNLATYAPGIFTNNGSGSGPAAILDSSYLVVTPSNPTSPGAFIQIYCTGLGPVTHQPATGAPASNNPLSSTTTLPLVTIGDMPATVQFSGLAPGEVGLYQVNVQVPEGVATGSAVPLTLSIGGAQANMTTVAIQ